MEITFHFRCKTFLAHSHIDFHVHLCKISFDGNSVGLKVLCETVSLSCIFAVWNCRKTNEKSFCLGWNIRPKETKMTGKPISNRSNWKCLLAIFRFLLHKFTLSISVLFMLRFQHDKIVRRTKPEQQYPPKKQKKKNNRFSFSHFGRIVIVVHFLNE